jgi:hypothetical protein
MKLSLLILLLLSTNVLADSLVFKFKSPSFSGIGYSAHKINLNNMRYNRKKSIRDELRSLELQLGLLEQREPINAFLSNLQTRIYSELSKQVTEQLFAEAGADAGQFTLDGNTVTWGKIGDTITLSVYSTEGEVTTITIPIGTLSLPDTGLGEDADNAEGE